MGRYAHSLFGFLSKSVSSTLRVLPWSITLHDPQLNLLCSNDDWLIPWNQWLNTNLCLWQKSLVMRMRIGYKVNGKDVLEEGQINNFPRGLWGWLYSHQKDLSVYFRQPNLKRKTSLAQAVDAAKAAFRLLIFSSYFGFVWDLGFSGFLFVQKFRCLESESDRGSTWVCV